MTLEELPKLPAGEPRVLKAARTINAKRKHFFSEARTQRLLLVTAFLLRLNGSFALQDIAVSLSTSADRI